MDPHEEAVCQGCNRTVYRYTMLRDLCQGCRFDDQPRTWGSRYHKHYEILRSKIDEASREDQYYENLRAQAEKLRKNTRASCQGCRFDDQPKTLTELFRELQPYTEALAKCVGARPGTWGSMFDDTDPEEDLQEDQYYENLRAQAEKIRKRYTRK